MNKAELINKIDHYRYDCDDTEFKKLTEQATSSFEQYVECLEEDKLIHHSRIECLLYLALIEKASLVDTVIEKLKSDIEYYKNQMIINSDMLPNVKIWFKAKLEYAEVLLKILEGN